MVAPGRMLIRSAADPERLRVESSREMAGWRARQPATPTRPWMPGTAIEVEGVEGFWEVVAATPRGTGVVYDLAPWPEGLVMRAVLPFSAAAGQAEMRERRGRARRDQARFGQLLAAPLLGLLPAHLQRRLEARQTYSAVRGTIISAGLLFAPAFVFTLAGLYEALACGCPVITVFEGGMKETVVDGSNGLVTDPDPAVMAVALTRLLAAPALAERLGSQARRFVQERFSLPAAIDRIEAEMEAVAARHRPQESAA